MENVFLFKKIITFCPSVCFPQSFNKIELCHDLSTAWWRSLHYSASLCQVVASLCGLCCVSFVWICRGFLYLYGCYSLGNMLREFPDILPLPPLFCSSMCWSLCAWFLTRGHETPHYSRPSAKLQCYWSQLAQHLSLVPISLSFKVLTIFLEKIDLHLGHAQRMPTYDIFHKIFLLLLNFWISGVTWFILQNQHSKHLSSIYRTQECSYFRNVKLVTVIEYL